MTKINCLNLIEYYESVYALVKVCGYPEYADVVLEVYKCHLGICNIMRELGMRDINKVLEPDQDIWDHAKIELDGYIWPKVSSGETVRQKLILMRVRINWLKNLLKTK